MGPVVTNPSTDGPTSTRKHSRGSQPPPVSRPCPEIRNHKIGILQRQLLRLFKGPVFDSRRRCLDLEPVHLDVPGESLFHLTIGLDDLLLGFLRDKRVPRRSPVDPDPLHRFGPFDKDCFSPDLCLGPGDETVVNFEVRHPKHRLVVPPGGHFEITDSEIDTSQFGMRPVLRQRNRVGEPSRRVAVGDVELEIGLQRLPCVFE